MEKPKNWKDYEQYRAIKEFEDGEKLEGAETSAKISFKIYWLACIGLLLIVEHIFEIDLVSREMEYLLYFIGSIIFAIYMFEQRFKRTNDTIRRMLETDPDE